ncbi:MAG: MFS transporter [Chloroflexi bacterium HGW-Chloroflexi-10]|nr:MAG: MFS transporter [Chloroflexi bacterium HGW-Chloroflexi-10]
MLNRRNLIILFFTLVVIMMGFGIIIPLLPFVLENFGGGGKELGFLMAIFSIAQFIFSPIWGSISDRVGRKPILLIGAFGNALAMLFFALSTELWMLYAARGLAGILSSATLPSAMAFIGDSTDEKNRGGGMGVIGAAMGVGMVLGPGIGGTLAKFSMTLPFYVAAILSTIAMVLILLVLPESLKKEQRSTSRKISGLKLKTLWDALFGPLGYLMVLSFIVFFALTNFEGIFPMFTQQRYNYDSVQVGVVMVVVGVVSALVQGFLTGPLTRRFGERMVIKGSLIGSAVGFVLMIFAFNDLTVYLTVGFFVLGNAMLRPGIASLVSRETVEGQGAALGLNNAFMSLGRIVGPIWAGFMLDINLNLPYISGAVVMLVIFVVSFSWLKPKPSRKSGGELIIDAKSAAD